jgi:hypothetical protein
VVFRGLLDQSDLEKEIEFTMNIICSPQVKYLFIRVPKTRGDKEHGGRISISLTLMTWNQGPKLNQNLSFALFCFIQAWPSLSKTERFKMFCPWL